MNTGEINECGQRITNEAKINRKRRKLSKSNKKSLQRNLKRDKGNQRQQSWGGKRNENYPKENPGTGYHCPAVSLVYKLYDSLKSFFSNLQLNTEWCVISPNNRLNRFKISGRY